MKSLSKVLSILLIVAMGLFAVACESDEGDTDDTAGVDTSTGDTGGDDTTGEVATPEFCGGEWAGGTKAFTGILIDFQTRKKLEGAKVTLLDNDTGEELGLTVDSLADGIVFMDVPNCYEKVGLVVRLDGQRDTYQLHLAADGVDETLWSVSEGTYVAAPALAGILAGGVYYVNADGEEEAIGCAKVRIMDLPDAEAFAEGNIRYMNTAGLPTTLDKQDGINQTTPFFIIGNIPAGPEKVVIEAQVDGQKVGETYVWSKPGTIFIGNIYADADITANPMDPNCQ
jgi:hypothetical protein